MKTAAIIIGCWEEHTQPTVLECYERIVNTINRDSSIETVWLNGDHLQTMPEVWYSNSRQVFVEECGVDWVRRAFEVAPRSQFATASHMITQQHFDNRLRLIVWEGWQVEYLLNHRFQHIERLHYFGIGWNKGVKRDHVGWGQTCDLMRHKHIRPRELVATPGCVLSNIAPHKDFRLFEFDKPNFEEHNWQKQNGLYVKKDLDWF